MRAGVFDALGTLYFRSRRFNPRLFHTLGVFHFSQHTLLAHLFCEADSKLPLILVVTEQPRDMTCTFCCCNSRTKAARARTTYMKKEIQDVVYEMSI